MPKITELNAITSVANNDLLMVVHDPNGLPSTNKITVNNFAKAISTNLNFAQGEYGSLPVSTGANTFVWKKNPEVRATRFVTSEYTATLDDSVILVDPTVNLSSVTVYLPVNVPEGKVYTVENKQVLGAYSYIVQVKTVDESEIIEHPVTLELTSNLYLPSASEGYSWIYINGNYRLLSVMHTPNVFYGSGNTYHQVAITNITPGEESSSDLVLYNDQGDYVAGTGPFIDMGIDSSVYNSTNYGNIWKPNDAYVYNHGGNLLIGPETDNSIKLFAGGTNEENTVAEFNKSDIIFHNHISYANTTTEFNIYTPNNIGIVLNSNSYIQLSASDDGRGGGIGQAVVTAYRDPTHVLSQVGIYVANSSNNSEWLFLANNTILFPDGSKQKTAYDPDHLTVGNLIPEANVTYSLGSPSRQWKDLYVSNNTIYINNIPLSIDNSGNLSVNGTPVGAASFDYLRKIDTHTVGIKPSPDFNNELSIYPTADYDIHLFESASNGAITLGNYGQTQFRVYGPGGSDAAGTDGNNIRAELDTGSSFLIRTHDTQDHNWKFESNGFLSFPDSGRMNLGNTETWIGYNGNDRYIELRSGNNTSNTIYTWTDQNSDYWETFTEYDGSDGHNYWSWITSQFESGVKERPKVFIQNHVDANTYTWNFNYDGALSVPGLINFNQNGYQIPSKTERTGEKLVLWDQYSTNTFSYSIGIEQDAMWFGVDTGLSTKGFNWYSGNTQVMDLTRDGNLTVQGNVNVIGTVLQNGSPVSGAAADKEWNNPNGHKWVIREYSDGYANTYDGSTPLVWFNTSNATAPAGAFLRGGIIEYHAYNGMTTTVGTITFTNDSGMSFPTDATHTEHSSGQSSGTQSYWKIISFDPITLAYTEPGYSRNILIQWTSKLFYGYEWYC